LKLFLCGDMGSLFGSQYLWVFALSRSQEYSDVIAVTLRHSDPISPLDPRRSRFCSLRLVFVRKRVSDIIIRLSIHLFNHKHIADYYTSAG
jgi:hypothetical protein